MPRVVIIGADGQLGSDLMRVFGTDAVGLTHRDIEITNPQSVKSALIKYKPEMVINTAGLTNVGVCESEPEKAFTINAVGAENVAKAAAELGAVNVFISTDYVFDGSKSSFTEEDVPNPLNVYGASKLAGERAVTAASPRHYIIRTSWCFGRNVSHKGHNFPTVMLRLAAEQPVVTVVNDQFGSPTYTKDLSMGIKAVIDTKAPFGIYHITNQGSCSWYEFAQEIFLLKGITTPLKPISGDNLKRFGLRRPKNSVLTNQALRRNGLPLLRSWREAIKDFLEQKSL